MLTPPGTPLQPFISRLIALGEISLEEQQAIERSCGPPHVVERDEMIVECGDEPEFSIALLRGIACRVNDLSGGRRQILSFQIPGDGIDLYGYALKRLDHSVLALNKCEISRIPHKALDDLVARFPRLARTLWRETILDTSFMREQLVRVGQRPALERTANLLCELAFRFDRAGIAGQRGYPLPLTQIQLGHALGLSAVHINRVFGSLKKDGLISFRRDEFTILDRNALTRLGDFNPTYMEPIKFSA